MASDRYAAPKSFVADVQTVGEVDLTRLNRVASGQRIVIVSLIVALAAIAVQAYVSPSAGLMMNLLSTALGIFGAVRLDGGLNGSVLSRVLYTIVLLLPLINLVIMLSLSHRATKALRASGYKDGFFGADQRSDA